MICKRVTERVTVRSYWQGKVINRIVAENIMIRRLVREGTSWRGRSYDWDTSKGRCVMGRKTLR